MLKMLVMFYDAMEFFRVVYYVTHFAFCIFLNVLLKITHAHTHTHTYVCVCLFLMFLNEVTYSY